MMFTIPQTPSVTLGFAPLPSQMREIVGTVPGISSDRARGDAALVADLGATGLDLVELVMAVEDVFGVEISDTEAEGLVTVDDLVALVARRRGR